MTRTFFKTYSNIHDLLPGHYKRKLVSLQALVIFTGAVDILGLASFIPVLTALADPSILEGDNFIADLKRWSGVADPLEFIFGLSLCSFFIFVVRSAVILFSQWIQSRFVFGASEYIGSSAYYDFLTSSYERFAAIDSAKVVRELTVSPTHFVRFLIMPILMLTSEFLVMGLVLIGIVAYNPQVFLIMLCTIFPIAYLFNRLLKRRIKKYGSTQNELTPQLYANSVRGIYGIIDVKLRGKEDILIEDYQRVFGKINRISIILEVLGVVPSKLFELVTVGGVVVIFLFGFIITDSPEKVLPLITVYAAAAYRMIPSLSRVLPGLLNLERFSYLFGIYSNLQNINPREKIHQSTAQLPFNSYIDIEGISFKYAGADEKLFENFSIRVNRGEIVGLIGRSGSGKTTLVNIIAGFLRPTEGAISVDGVTLTEENLTAWMQNISYVQQSPYLEQGSLTKNIAFLEDGSSVDREKLDRVIRISSLSDVIDGKDPDEVHIEEFGKNLSGGQKQRVVLARALYCNSKLIILDEATSALDNETEEDINQAINNLKGTDTTVIIIAHRYSTLKHTDRIFRLENGKLMEEVSYSQII